jgi:glycosidase
MRTPGRLPVLVATLFATCGPLAFADPAPIDHVDPPNWWVGFRAPTVQLLVHGEGIATTTPALAYPGVRITEVGHGASPNYLYVTLAIDTTAAPGHLPLDFRRDDTTVAHLEYPLEQRRAGSAARHGFDAADVMLLVMPDRFANGDPSNDQAPGTHDRFNRRAGFDRHGGDLAGLRQHLDYLAGMGYTQLWLTPVVENAQPEFSYHGYSITDHYRVDPRYGSNEDLKALSGEARQHGIGIVADLVLNHVGSGHWWMKDLPDPAWLSAGPEVRTNNAHKSVQDVHAAEADRRQFIDGWFDSRMPDLHPMYAPLGNYLVQNAIWWVEYADLSGLRVDTLPYTDKRYVADFMQRVMAEYPDLNIVGEESNDDPAIPAYWQRGHRNADGFDSHLPSVMDFPTRRALLDALKAPTSQHDALMKVYESVADDFLYPDPQRLLVFADNHDTDRIYTELGRDDALWRIAMAFVATTRGIPQILYGTETLMANDRLGDDGDRRRDFPGGWAGDRTNAFTGQGLSPRAAAAQSYLRTLLTWRRHSNAVRSGTLTHYMPAGDVYVYFRAAGDERVMVVLNRNSVATTLDLARFRDDLHGARGARDVIGGRHVALGTTLLLPARSATVLDLDAAP